MVAGKQDAEGREAEREEAECKNRNKEVEGKKVGRKSICDISEASVLLYLLQCAVRGEAPKADKLKNVDYEQLWKDSCFHNVEPMVYRALEFYAAKNASDEAFCHIYAKFKEGKERTARKNALMDIERAQLEAWMESKGIWYAALKGSVIQGLYPGFGLRKMADNDLWFDKAYAEWVRDYFLEKGYEVSEFNMGNHDVYFKEPVYNFEMHRDLFVEGYNPAWDEYFAEAQTRMEPAEGKTFARLLSKEDFYLYYIAHAFHHHDALGGIGVKVCVDVHYYLEAYEQEMDLVALEQALEKLGLLEYEKALRGLTKKLFSLETTLDESMAASLTEAEKHLLLQMTAAGAFGVYENVVDSKMGEGKLSDKLKYYKKRLAPDEWFLKAYYPFFYRHKWLRPVGNVYRVLKGICKHPKMLFVEWKRVWGKRK